VAWIIEMGGDQALSLEIPVDHQFVPEEPVWKKKNLS
jgi:hypothetical protein